LDIAQQTLRAIALCHNYNSWIYKIIKPYLGKKVLEVGCGVGNLSGLLRESRELVAIDCQELYVKYINLDFPDVKVYNYDITREGVLALRKHNFDTIVCINVLEHIEDDLRALSNIYELLKSGGRLVLLIPAHPFLYGPLDRNVSHWRRYSKQGLVNKLKDANFRIEKVSYFNRLGALGWFLNARIRKKKQISFVQLFLFDRFVPFLSEIDSYFNLPWGLSLLAVGVKD